MKYTYISVDKKLNNLHFEVSLACGDYKRNMLRRLDRFESELKYGKDVWFCGIPTIRYGAQ